MKKATMNVFKFLVFTVLLMFGNKLVCQEAGPYELNNSLDIP